MTRVLDLSFGAFTGSAYSSSLGIAVGAGSVRIGYFILQFSNPEKLITGLPSPRSEGRSTILEGSSMRTRCKHAISKTLSILRIIILIVQETRYGFFSAFEIEMTTKNYIQSID